MEPESVEGAAIGKELLRDQIRGSLARELSCQLDMGEEGEEVNGNTKKAVFEGSEPFLHLPLGVCLLLLIEKYEQPCDSDHWKQ